MNKHDPRTRTSLCTSLRASVTLEAAMAVPVFFFAVVCLIYLFEIATIQVSVRAAVHNACKKATQEIVLFPVLLPTAVTSDVIDSIGRERLERSIVVGGSGGISCYGSYAEPETGVIKIAAKYNLRLPFPGFHLPILSFREEVRMKGWTGYIKPTMGNEGGTIVYVTDTGTVYHKNRHCTHLDLSIQMVPGNKVAGLRNEMQGKYKACERCSHSGTTVGLVYITDTGSRYHGTLKCSGLKRRVYAVPLSEAEGKGACSRCGA